MDASFEVQIGRHSCDIVNPAVVWRLVVSESGCFVWMKAHICLNVSVPGGGDPGGSSLHSPPPPVHSTVSPYIDKLAIASVGVDWSAPGCETAIWYPISVCWLRVSRCRRQIGLASPRAAASPRRTVVTVCWPCLVSLVDAETGADTGDGCWLSKHWVWLNIRLHQDVRWVLLRQMFP